MKEEGQDVRGGRVRPLHVIEQERHWVLYCQKLKQRPDCACHAVPSIRRWGRLDPRHPGDGRHYGGELRQVLVVKPARRVIREVAVERINEKREWHGAPGLGWA